MSYAELKRLEESEGSKRVVCGRGQKRSSLSPEKHQMQPQSTKLAKQSILPSAPISDNDLQKPQMAAWRDPQLTFEETAKEEINISEGVEVLTQTNVHLYYSYTFVLL